jgi:signal transduction histidine kinase
VQQKTPPFETAFFFAHPAQYPNSYSTISAVAPSQNLDIGLYSAAMHSIRFRLSALFIVVTTATLTLFGFYGHYLLAGDLDESFKQLQEGTVTRLTISIPSPMWDMNTAVGQSILEAEMVPDEVSAIQVFDSDARLFAAAARDKSGKIGPSTQTEKFAGVPVEAQLYRQTGVKVTAENATQAGPSIGRIVVYFSRHKIEAALRGNVLRRIMEVLVVDALLILAMTYSLRLVFIPLGRLRDALLDLAHHESEEVEELPETQRDEFGEVIKGFNQTQRKLKQVIERTKKAEEETRAQSVKTEQAYTELQTAQESLVQAEKMASLGGLVAGVAHEINTPIGITLTSASVLMEATDNLHKSMTDGGMKKSEVATYINMAIESTRLIMKNSERAAHLIQSFKQVAADQTSEQRREYEIGEYVEEVMSSLHPKLKQGNVKVKIICPAPIRLDGYPGAMAQVLTNLTMNTMAHAFTEDGGEIEVAASQADKFATITFTDNGRGIPADNVSKIFDPFFTTRRGTGGTGLGLNIVFNIINKQFGGTIAVQSEIGKGSCFTIRIPLVSPASAPDVKSAAS